MMRSMDKLLFPFWEGNTAYDESVMFLSENGETPWASLFFEPTEILHISSTDYETEYVRGIDWETVDGRLYLLDGTAIPSMKKEELHFYSDETKDCFPAKDGGKILCKGAGYFHQRQALVTYRHEGQWMPSKSVLGSRALENTKKKMKENKNITICFYGDSITAGCDSSKRMNVAPFMESWPQLVTAEIKKKYGCEIQYVNTAVGGKLSDWGLENVQERVVAHNPDVVVLAFGMNDGTEQVSPEEFKHNIMGMKGQILKNNSSTEFILIATTVANAESVFDGCQREYRDVLAECMNPGDVLVNMTEVHDALLSRKKFCDMTGNNINHPNDYLVRVYAQVILQLIQKALSFS